MIKRGCSIAAIARYHGVARSTIASRIKEINEDVKNKKVEKI